MEEKSEKRDLIPVLNYLGILVVASLLMRWNDEFNQFHARQGLILFAVEIVTVIFSTFPFIGQFIGFICWPLWLVLSVIGINNVVNKKKVPLPILGELIDRIQV